MRSTLGACDPDAPWTSPPGGDGTQVEAIDISEDALAEAGRRAAEKNVRIAFRQADLDNIELPEAVYDLVININFLQRSLVPKIKKALKIGGRVIFETYLIDQQTIGHPKNPAYLLGHGELLGLFSDFRVFCYREGKFTEAGKDAFRAGLYGQKVK
ncbi:MAG: class I SAM-dependent methyltransferase [Deltaproteobacteria bacterium]|nr:class I SAM-dependent methyltransferase [Deltaproteobacteria bacterium]